jgi:hypothetical protein
MSTNNCSTFDQPRPISTSATGLQQLASLPCDFLTFLAVAQNLKLDFLPITWQAAMQPVGIGGTSQVNQAPIDVQTSFVFKRVGEEQKWKETEERIFQVLISEITVLCHPSVRAHPNIAELQGVCWDIPNKETDRVERVIVPQYDNKVWPVLVFEKSHFGDLHHFATQSVGRALGIEERMELCLDIGTAVADMHLNRKSFLCD